MLEAVEQAASHEVTAPDQLVFAKRDVNKDFDNELIRYVQGIAQGLPHDSLAGSLWRLPSTMSQLENRVAKKFGIQKTVPTTPKNRDSQSTLRRIAIVKAARAAGLLPLNVDHFIGERDGKQVRIPKLM
jgi:hypothetical protein